MFPVEEAKSRRTRFLQKLYELHAKDPRANFFNEFDIGRELGFDGDLVEGVVRYLAGKGLVKTWHDLGGVSLTHLGIDSVEAEFSTNSNPTVRTPSANSIYIMGNVTNSQIQQASPCAAQSSVAGSPPASRQGGTRLVKDLPAYANDAVAWSKSYTKRLSALQGQLWPQVREVSSPEWRAEVLELLQVLDEINTHILAYHGVPTEASAVHRVFKDIALHMNAAAVLLRTAIHEANDALIDGEASDEMKIASRLAIEDLPRELSKVTPTLTIPVQCQVHGHENIRVYFRIDNIEELTTRYLLRINELSQEEFLSFLSQSLVRFDNWDLKDNTGRLVPVPNPQNPTSYLIFVRDDEATRILQWALESGYKEAVRIAQQAQR